MLRVDGAHARRKQQTQNSRSHIHSHKDTREILQGSLYCLPNTPIPPVMVRESPSSAPKACLQRRFGQRIDLAWNPGVDHDFDAAENLLHPGLSSSFKNCKSREREQFLTENLNNEREATEFQARVWGTKTDSACWHLRLACSVHICGASSICQDR
jgi:hypothetical protein